MVKKILFTVTLCLILAYPVGAFEATSQVQVGWLAQEGIHSGFAYAIGFDVPIITVSESGYKLTTFTTAVYSDNALGNELYAIRVFGVNQKSLWTSGNFQAYLAMGGGFWDFIEADGSDNRQTAYLFALGVDWRQLILELSCDLVSVQDGPDIYFPSVGLTFKFL